MINLTISTLLLCTSFLIQLDNFTIHQIGSEKQEITVDIIKQYYLNEHVLVRSRNMDLYEDKAIDEYIRTLLKQGNSLYAKIADSTLAGVVINHAASPVDPKNLRQYASHRQDPNTKDFLNFTAKLQETPNLWNIYNEPKIFEIKMLTVIPEFRRMGLAVTLAEKSVLLAKDLGYKVIRIDCINAYDYKIAERCMMSCIVRYPLHKLRNTTAPFIKCSSEYNQCVRVYVDTRTQFDSPDTVVKQRDLDCIFE